MVIEIETTDGIDTISERGTSLETSTISCESRDTITCTLQSWF